MYMKPEALHILQQRFRHHEVDVDPGVWNAIQTQVATPSADPIEELFRDRFQGHEAPVDPSLWNAINAQIGQGAMAGSAATGGSIFGWAAVGVGALVIAGGLYLVTRSDPAEKTELAVIENTDAKVETPIPQEDPLAEALPIVIEESADDVVEEAVTEETVVADRIPASIGTRSETTTTTPVKDPVPLPVDPVQAATPTQNVPDPIEHTTANDEVADEPEDEEGLKVVESIIEKIKEEAAIEPEIAPVPQPKDVPSSGTSDQNDLRSESTPPPVIEAPLPQLYMPNVFTPNGDGDNDAYTLDLTGFRSMRVRIISLQTNDVVFSIDTEEEWEWDGRNCLPGHYLVAVEAITEDGRLVTKGKAVWLNRE